MAFPFIVENNFETGTVSDEWDSETDTASQLDIAHYTELARYPWPTCAPYQGAYAGRAVLSGGTADAFFVDGECNVALDARNYFAFPIWLSPDFTASADDTVNILELVASATAEVTFGLRVVAATDVINFGIGETAPTSWSSLAIERGVWYWVELDVTLDDGASNDGTIDIYITKAGEPAATAVAATQVASLDQGAITDARLGVQDHLATTTGVILFGGLYQDDARIYPMTRRYETTKTLTKSGHVFVGNGCIENITLLSGAGTDNVVQVYDTDIADTNDPSQVKLELKNTANNETVDPAGVPVTIIRGAYVSLSGTNPRAKIKISKVSCFSDANTRSYAHRRGL